MSLEYCLTEQQQDTNENYIYNKNISKLLTVFAQSDVLALGEEADFETLTCLPALNLIRSTKLHLSTEPAFLSSPVSSCVIE